MFKVFKTIIFLFYDYILHSSGESLMSCEEQIVNRKIKEEFIYDIIATSYSLNNENKEMQLEWVLCTLIFYWVSYLSTTHLILIMLTTNLILNLLDTYQLRLV